MMADPGKYDSEAILADAATRDPVARGLLLERFRPRLTRMVELRMDRRLAARIDAADVVQETFMNAAVQLDGYLKDRPIPLYPWLRRLAWERMNDAYRRHIIAGRRSIDREEPPATPDESVFALAERLTSPAEGPSTIMGRAERRKKVRAALDQLPEHDREILMLRYLEDLTTAEAAAVTGISESAVKLRVYRAMKRLGELLGEGSGA